MVINFPSTWVILDLPICSLGPLHTALQNACSSNYLTQFTALHEFNPLADLHHYPSKTGAQQGFPVFTFHTPPGAKSPPAVPFAQNSLPSLHLPRDCHLSGWYPSDGSMLCSWACFSLQDSFPLWQRWFHSSGPNPISWWKTFLTFQVKMNLFSLLIIA